MPELSTLAQAEHIVADAMFPVPGGIELDLPGAVSAEALGLLQDAIALCRPLRPGFTLFPPAEAEIAAVSRACEALADRLPIEAPTGSRISEKDQAFDRFFGIARSADPDAFVTGMVRGVVALLDELNRPHSLVPAESDALAHGFYRMAASLSPAFATRPRTAHDEIPRTGEPDCLERWRNGHLIFVALTGGLILQHMRAIEALERDNTLAAVAALGDARCLFIASAAAMRLAGDMTPADYDKVRAQMSPPRVPEGFSGLFDADHRRLLQLTKRLGALLADVGPELSWAREEYWLALNDTYTGHRWVCERLIGKSTSLATAASTERPGHVTLEGFAKRALSLGGYPAAG